ncbi:sporulation membrane protein YtaF [Clostridium sp. NSJ-6]|uniref:Sporulation membrane protein YtaF n=1 Tax=Clostridium hominis TaxID=2763036 RepID=A0ABR7DBR1_9CLOT|nr:sporulation membrane protein YtaF [Clostridium hominis]MBC5628845.1 sporulation membrane protein YtaF [Clostridium hominis]
MKSFVFLSVIESFLLVTALSMDAFVASFAYGTNKIKIPFKSVAIINIICTSFLAIALLVGNIVKDYIPAEVTSWVCFSVLFILGIIKIFDSSLKSWLKKGVSNSQDVSFKLLDFRFFLKVCSDSTEADRDKSKILSSMEATSLAIALSLDGLAAGFSVALLEANFFEIVIFSLITGMIAVILGCFIGNKVAEKININISWISGLILMILAFIKIL